MIRFAQKQYTEYDAMRALYVELMRNSVEKTRFEVIDKSALIPVLKGNSVVIERFVVSTSKYGNDKFRMYLKIGAKAKLPDRVRLANSNVYRQKFLDLSLSFRGQQQGLQSGGDKNLGIRSEIKSPSNFSLEREIQELLGEALEYNKRDRSLVLEFSNISNAIRALDILPFGLNYKIYLLDA